MPGRQVDDAEGDDEVEFDEDVASVASQSVFKITVLIVV